MKKIINGKLYDTSTAKKKAEYSDGLSGRDFHHTYEQLYLKRTGEYFLYGKGGPASAYAHQIERNSYEGGEDIRPMTYAEAQSWSEKHLNADEYQEIFGSISDDDTTTVISLSLPSSVADLARRNASISGKTLSAYIADLISQ